MSSLPAKTRTRTGLDGNPVCPGCGANRCTVIRPPGVCDHCDGQGNWKRRGPDTCRNCERGKLHPYVWCHRHDKAFRLDAETIVNLPPAKPEFERAPIDERDEVFDALLDCLLLQKDHLRHLREERGLSEVMIKSAKFRSVPLHRGFDEVVADLAQQFNLEGVPGFFQVEGKWCWRGCGYDGILIPIRDYEGQIEALQIRWLQPKNPKAKYMMVSGAPKDLPHAGTPSGAPNHFLRFNAGAKCAVIVEGILKSIVASEYAHLVGLTCPIVACVGTGTFGQMARELKGLLPGLRLAWTAFDRNEQGKGAEDTQKRRERLHSLFAEVGVKAEAMEWEGVKGIDDWLLMKARSI